MQCSSIELSLNTEQGLRQPKRQKRSIRGGSGDIMAGDMGLVLASLLACAAGPKRSGQLCKSTPGAGTRCGQVLRKTRRSTSGHGCSLSMTRNGFLLLFCRNGREKHSSTPAEIRGVETLRLGCTEKDQVQEMLLLSGLRGIDLNDASSPASGAGDRPV